MHTISMADTKLEDPKHSHGEFFHVPTKTLNIHKNMQYNINLSINPLYKSYQACMEPSMKRIDRELRLKPLILPNPSIQSLNNFERNNS